MFSDYIFYDGLLKEVKRDYADKSLQLLVECRDNQETYLLARQITRLANDFEKEGGFTERLYKIRAKKRKK